MIIQIIRKNDEIIINASKGDTLLNAAEDNDIEEIYSACGGIAGCGGCLVDIIEGECGEINAREKILLAELEEPETCRLACQIIIKTDMKIRTTS